MQPARILFRWENYDNPELTQEERDRLLGMIYPWNEPLYTRMSTQQKTEFLRLRTKDQFHTFTLEHAAMVGCAERIDLLWQRLQDMIEHETDDEEDEALIFLRDGLHIIPDMLDLEFGRHPEPLQAWSSKTKVLDMHSEEHVHHIVDKTVVYGNCPTCYATSPLGFSCRSCRGQPRSKIIYFVKDERDLEEERPMRPAHPAELASHAGFTSVPKFLDEAFFNHADGRHDYSEDIDTMSIKQSLRTLYVKLETVTTTPNMFLMDRFEIRMKAITNAKSQAIYDTTNAFSGYFGSTEWQDVEHHRRYPYEMDSSEEEEEAQEDEGEDQADEIEEDE